MELPLSFIRIYFCSSVQLFLFSIPTVISCLCLLFHFFGVFPLFFFFYSHPFLVGLSCPSSCTPSSYLLFPTLSLFFLFVLARIGNGTVTAYSILPITNTIYVIRYHYHTNIVSIIKYYYRTNINQLTVTRIIRQKIEQIKYTHFKL